MAIDINSIMQIANTASNVINAANSSGGSSGQPTSRSAGYTQQIQKNQRTGDQLDSAIGSIPAVGQVYGLVNAGTDIISDVAIGGPDNPDGTYRTNARAGVAEVLDGATHVANAFTLGKEGGSGLEVVGSMLLPGYGGAKLNDIYKKKAIEEGTKAQQGFAESKQGAYEDFMGQQQYSQVKGQMNTMGMGGFTGGNPLKTDDTTEIEGPHHSEGGVTIRQPSQKQDGIELEGGEVKWGDFIFSDRIQFDK